MELEFNGTEQSILTQAIAFQEPSIFVKVRERMRDLTIRINSQGVLTYTRDEIWSMFVCLINLHHNIWGESNRKLITMELMKKFWNQVIDRRKEEALWSMYFRTQLESWNIPYKEDMIRIGVPENVEDEE